MYSLVLRNNLPFLLKSSCTMLLWFQKNIFLTFQRYILPKATNQRNLLLLNYHQLQQRHLYNIALHYNSMTYLLRKTKHYLYGIVCLIFPHLQVPKLLRKSLQPIPLFLLSFWLLQEWLHSEIDLLNFTKGYLKEKVRFYSDSHFSKPLRSWEKFLGHSKPVSIIISKPKTELEQKLEWFTYKGSGAILKAYKFLYDNNLLHEYEKSNYLALNNMEYPPDLASGLIERAILFKREDLIPTIKENIKRRN